MSTEITTYQPQQTAIVRHSLDEIQMMAKSMASSRLFPGIQNEQQAFALMLLCEADGIHPAHALRRYHIINGTPTMKAETMLAEFRARGGKVRWLERTDERVSAIFVIGDEESPPITWDEQRVRRAQLGGNHGKFPCQMKTARVISEGVRLMAPGIVQGVYTPEEYEDSIAPAERPRQERTQTRGAASQQRLEHAIGADQPATVIDTTHKPAPEPTPPTLSDRCRAAKGSKEIAALAQECATAKDRQAASELAQNTIWTVERLPELKRESAREHARSLWQPYLELLDAELVAALGFAVIADEPESKADPLETPEQHPDDEPPFEAPAQTEAQRLLAIIAAAADLPALLRAEQDVAHNIRSLTADEKRQVMQAMKARKAEMAG